MAFLFEAAQRARVVVFGSAQHADRALPRVHPKSGFERARRVRPALARREEAAGSALARTSNEAGAGRAIRVRSGLTQKVRLNKVEKLIRDKAFSEELSGQSRI